ncbi:hypothetical protein HB799_06070 [Listeria welshimeri]|nr:hypothetical protein [Listeria welshimeri]MBC1770693.1 hypothetical protein [Listeria welshimeri]
MVKIVTPKIYREKVTEESIREQKDVQDFINNQQLKMHKGTVNCIVLRGEYIAIRKKMHVSFVLINNCDFGVESIKLNLQFESNKLNELKFAIATIIFDSKYLGKLENDEGIIVHMEVPVLGTVNKLIYKSTELKAILDNVEVIPISRQEE